MFKVNRSFSPKGMRSRIRLLVRSVKGLQTRANPDITPGKKNNPNIFLDCCFLDSGSLNCHGGYHIEVYAAFTRTNYGNPRNLISGFANSTLSIEIVIPDYLNICKNLSRWRRWLSKLSNCTATSSTYDLANDFLWHNTASITLASLLLSKTSPKFDRNAGQYL